MINKTKKEELLKSAGLSKHQAAALAPDLTLEDIQRWRLDRDNPVLTQKGTLVAIVKFTPSCEPEARKKAKDSLRHDFSKECKEPVEVIDKNDTGLTDSQYEALTGKNADTTVRPELVAKKTTEIGAKIGTPTIALLRMTPREQAMLFAKSDRMPSEETSGIATKIAASGTTTSWDGEYGAPTPFHIDAKPDRID